MLPTSVFLLLDKNGGERSPSLQKHLFITACIFTKISHLGGDAQKAHAASLPSLACCCCPCLFEGHPLARLHSQSALGTGLICGQLSLFGPFFCQSRSTSRTDWTQMQPLCQLLPGGTVLLGWTWGFCCSLSLPLVLPRQVQLGRHRPFGAGS